MRLYLKGLAIVLVTMFVAVIIVNAGISLTIIKGLEESERTEIAKDLQRGRDFVYDEMDGMLARCNDNAHWNVTYDYVLSPGGWYVNEFFPKETFNYINFNFLLIYNNSKACVDGAAYDFETNALVPIPSSLFEFIDSNPAFIEHDETEDSHGIFANIQEGPLILVSSPILTTEEEGPIRGSMVMGRFIDESEVQHISDTAHIQMDIRVIGGDLPEDFQSALLDENLLNSSQAVRVIGHDEIAAYGLLDDINGDALLIVKVMSDRSAYNQGLENANLLSVLSMVAVLLFGSMAMLLLQRYVFSPLSKLNQDMGRIGRSRDLSARVDVTGTKDEVSDLGSAFNGVLSELELKTASLERSEERYRELVESTIDWIWQIDMDGGFVFSNRNVQTLLGHSAEDLVGNSLFDLLEPSDKEWMLVKFRTLSRDKAPLRSEVMRVRGIDNRTLYLEVNASPVIGPAGELLGYRGVSRDITERKRVERALEKVNKQLDLLSSITRHDILNQTTILRGYNELIRDTSSDERILAYLEKEKRAIDTIDRQIKFTSIYKGLGTVEPTWQDITRKVATVISEQEIKDIEVTNELGNIEVLADPILERAFFNLIDNAQRHSGAKRLRIHQRITPEGLLIIFQDDGRGIPSHMKEQIFMRGYGQNTGLGLFLVREILGITEISIRETGAPGEGARFEVLVPNGAWRTKEQGEGEAPSQKG